MATLSSTTRVPTSPKTADERPIPPLENGDRLTRAEFFRRYEAMPDHVKAERIEGVVYMSAAAVSASFHGEPHFRFITWLGTYVALTPGVAGADNSTTTLDMDNDPQPDVCLYVLPTHGGSVKLTPETGYIAGSPELVVEVAGSSASLDLGAKLDVYRRNGVREYVVHRTYDGEVDWFALRDGQFKPVIPSADGIIRSEVFPGLWLNVPALIQAKLADVLATLQQGCASEAHVEFVKALAAKQGAPI
jgi:Uma2 family endonuclease